MSNKSTGIINNLLNLGAIDLNLSSMVDLKLCHEKLFNGSRN